MNAKSETACAFQLSYFLSDARSDSYASTRENASPSSRHPGVRCPPWGHGGRVVRGYSEGTLRLTPGQVRVCARAYCRRAKRTCAMMHFSRGYRRSRGDRDSVSRKYVIGRDGSSLFVLGTFT